MISVIIVTWNSEGYIRKCLESVKNQKEKEIELIVIDNNSNDATKDIVKSFHPDILIQNSENVGFSEANNQGIRTSHGEYIFTLNPDVILEPDFLRQVKKIIEFDKNIGTVSGQLICPDGTIDSQGIYLSNIRRFFDIGQGALITKSYKLIGPCAAAGLYRKEMLEDVKIPLNPPFTKEEIGGFEYFDEDFFAYVEDVDLAWRAKNRGWNAGYCPEAKAIHLRGGSRINSKWKQFLSFRNRYLMIIKNESPLHFLKYLLPFIFYDTLRIFYMSFSNKYFYINIKDYFNLIPKEWKKRKLITKN